MKITTPNIKGFISIPVGENDIPIITDKMKEQCDGKFSWEEVEDYPDISGIMCEELVTRVVPWEVCETIYKSMVKATYIK